MSLALLSALGACALNACSSDDSGTSAGGGAGSAAGGAAGRTSSGGASGAAGAGASSGGAAHAGEAGAGGASAGSAGSGATGGDGSAAGTSGFIDDPCALPGSLQFTANGTVSVAGGSAAWPSLSFLHLPEGFCAHYYGTIGDARQLRFAPGGELFVASPTGATTGGNATAGLRAILTLPDDDRDGVADQNLAFLAFDGTASTYNQGLLFANGYFYYQDGTPPTGGFVGTKLMRMPYASGDRAPTAASELIADVTYYSSQLHWPKAMDIADDGTIYAGNGGDQSETCDASHPVHGAILQIDAAPGSNPGGLPIVKGLRNPISIRCARGKNRCFALELAKDYTAGSGGREKMIPIRAGDDWGFPCCATHNLPYTDSPPGSDCSGVTSEDNSFLIGDTPFDVDFETGKWPGTWAHRAYVVTHGAAGTWTGARMVAIPMDPDTGLPTPSSNTSGSDVGMVDFATGWDDGTRLHGRPAALAFAPDGRLFVANDNNGVIFWIAAMNP